MAGFTSSADKVLSAATEACLISVNGGIFAVLFRGDLQHVVRLNSSAEILVRLATETDDSDALVVEYASELEVPKDIAAEFIEMIAADWTRLGIIGPESRASADMDSAAYPAPPEIGDSFFDQIVSIGGRPIRLALHDPDLAKITAPMVAGNAVPEPPELTFTVRAWRNGKIWFLSDSAGNHDAVSSIEVARDRVLARVMANSWPTLSDAPCIHGATLRAPNGGHIMLSGDSGQGKTTLALGLARCSFELLADDMSVLDVQAKRVYPMKTNPSVKQGSWEPLSALYPELGAQDPIEVNGRLCKYVRRPPYLGTEPAHAVDALIFPNWKAGATAQLGRHDPIRAVQSMLRWSYLPHHQENLQAMADFLAGLPLYELTYSEFAQADRMLLDLLQCQT